MSIGQSLRSLVACREMCTAMLVYHTAGARQLQVREHRTGCQTSMAGSMASAASLLPMYIRARYNRTMLSSRICPSQFKARCGHAGPRHVWSIRCSILPFHTRGKSSTVGSKHVWGNSPQAMSAFHKLVTVCCCDHDSGKQFMRLDSLQVGMLTGKKIAVCKQGTQSAP